MQDSFIGHIGLTVVQEVRCPNKNMAWPSLTIAMAMLYHNSPAQRAGGAPAPSCVSLRKKRVQFHLSPR